MIQKFKCAECGCKFEADDANVKCPVCGSENVSLDKGTSPAVLAGAFVGCLVIGLGIGFAITHIGGGSSSSSGSYGGSMGSSTPTEVRSGKTKLEDGEEPKTPLVSQSTPVIVNISDVTLSGGSYKVKVTATCPDGMSYELLDNTGKQVAKSTNGSFTNVPATSEEVGGIYTLVVTNTKTKEKVEKPIPGFVKIAQQPVQKLTRAELQSIFNSGKKPSDMAKKFATKYTLTCTGLEPDEPAPDRYDEIFNRLVGAWDSVEVTSVSYNDLNKITALSIKVNQ